MGESTHAYQLSSLLHEAQVMRVMFRLLMLPCTTHSSDLALMEPVASSRGIPATLRTSA